MNNSQKYQDSTWRRKFITNMLLNRNKTVTCLERRTCEGATVCEERVTSRWPFRAPLWVNGKPHSTNPFGICLGGGSGGAAGQKREDFDKRFTSYGGAQPGKRYALPRTAGSQNSDQAPRGDLTEIPTRSIKNPYPVALGSGIIRAKPGGRRPDRLERLGRPSCSQGLGEPGEALRASPAAPLGLGNLCTPTLWAPNYPNRIYQTNQVNPKHKNYQLYSLLLDRDLPVIATGNIRSHRLAPTLGETLGSISADRIDQVREELRTPYGLGELRPLTVILDKIVLEAPRMISEVVYEPTFNEMSHGFRPGKSCHTALRDIRTNFFATAWAIEGNIGNYYDTIDQHILTGIMKRKIGDERLIRLIRGVDGCEFNTTKAACWLGGGSTHKKTPNLPTGSNNVGVPIGNQISPILVNIHYNELDQWMMEKIRGFRGGKERPVGPLRVFWRRSTESMRITSQLKYARKKGRTQRIAELESQQKRTPVEIMDDENFRRLKYVRYVDDSTIGVTAPLSEAKQLKTEIAFPPRERPKLAGEGGTRITNPYSEETLFLGTTISLKGPHTQQSSEQRISSVIRKPRIAPVRVKAPMEKIIALLHRMHVLSQGGRKPLPITRLKHNSHDRIVQYYDVVIRDFPNYYSSADNWSDFSLRLRLFLRSSCVRTSAARYKKYRPRKLFRRYGRCPASIINTPIEDGELEIDHLSKLQRTVVRSALGRAVKLHSRCANANKAGKEILDTYFVPQQTGGILLRCQGPRLKYCHQTPCLEEHFVLMRGYNLIPNRRSPLSVGSNEYEFLPGEAR